MCKEETATKTNAQIVNEKLSEIQKSLKAPKGQFNSFGKYKYRNCEDILEALKPLLGTMTVTVSDSIKQVGERIYIEATARFGNGDHFISNTAFAREPISQKGMNEAQITGSSSSYARKYALNGLFCIDDNKDPDTQPPPSNNNKNNTGSKPTFNLTKEIETLAGRLCKGMNADQKVKFVADNINKKGFAAIKTMGDEELSRIIENLKDLH